MRLFNKHHKASPRKNPTSRRIQNIGRAFERVFHENPQRYKEVFKEAFGKDPLSKGKEHDPMAELYEAIGKRAGEEKKLRELEALFPGPRLDPKQEVAARKLANKLASINRKLARLKDDDKEAIRDLKDERKAVKRQIDELHLEMSEPSRALREQRGKVGRARRAEAQLKLEEEGRRRLTQRGPGSRGRSFRHGEEETARMEELEAQSRLEMTGKKPGAGKRHGVPLGELFPIEDTGFRGLIQPPIPGQTGLFAKEYSWSLYDPNDELLLAGTASTHSTASKSVRIAFEVATDLANDVDLDRSRKQWLRDIDKAPGFDRWVRRAKSEGERGILRRFKKRGIAAAGKGFQTYESRTRAGARRFKRPVELSLGEEESTKGQDYTVIVRRDMEGYWTKVVTKTDPELGKSFETGWAGPFSGADAIGKAYVKGEMVGAQLTGAKEFLAANPSRRRALASSARRALAKSNPKFDREALSGEEQFRDIETSIGIPDDPDQAYRVGYAWGVIRGIDTCGVQNFLKRRKIRKQYEKQILDAYKQIAKAAVAPPSGEGKSPRLPRTVS